MKQKLQEYALIAEIISAIAIVLSLIFVGLQVSQGNKETAANTEALHSQVRESMLNSDLDMLGRALDYPHLIESNFRLAGKTEQEISQMVVWIFQFNRTRENFWMQHNNGILDTDTYLSYRAPFIDLLIQNELAGQIWQEQSRHQLTPGFVIEINEILIAEGRFTSEELTQ